MNANQPTDEASVPPTPGDGSTRKRRARSARSLRAKEGRASLQGPVKRIADLANGISRNVRSRPLESITIALGIGFVVGGALSFRAGRIVLGVAARHLARQFLKQVL